MDCALKDIIISLKFARELYNARISLISPESGGYNNSNDKGFVKF